MTSRWTPWSARPARLVFVGAGPRTVGLLERFAASAPELLDPSAAIAIDVVDPYPPGGGRIWRRAQSPLLWMNSMASDVTIFTDESVTCDGPIVPGPSLAEWAAGAGKARLTALGLSAEPTEFPSRIAQAEYLAWAWDRVLRSLPDTVTVTMHEDRAVALDDDLVVLSSGAELPADLVVLALGYLDRLPTPEQAAIAQQARENDLTYIGPGYTADVDLSAIRAGEPVIVRGFGQAFVDLMVLLGEGRGGQFSEDGGVLTYHPSGREPIQYVGSRRGVPYHAKLGYVAPGATPVPTRYLTSEALASRRRDGLLDFVADVKPLLHKELAYAHYARLFGVHPERTRWSWERFEPVLDRCLLDDAELIAAAGEAVPDPEDRFVVAAIDRPLAGLEFTDRAELEAELVALIEADLRRRADPAYSADLAVFNALLSVYAVLSAAITAGWLSDADRVHHVELEWHGFFSFLASGPPPERLEQLLAMHRAGIVRFAGPDLEVELVGDRFVARSRSVPGTITARAFVEARLPRPDVLAAPDPLVRNLLHSGRVAANAGQLTADPECRAVRADGTVDPDLFMLGPSVSGSAGSSGFSRPHFNGAGFRQNDRAARHLLLRLAEVASSRTRRKDDERYAS